MLEPSATKAKNKQDLEDLILQYTQKGGVTTVCETAIATGATHQQLIRRPRQSSELVDLEQK
jgi:hypothetical protein